MESEVKQCEPKPGTTAIGWGGFPLCQALMELCGLNVGGDVRRVVDFVIEVKSDHPIVVYVKEHASEPTPEQFARVAHLLKTEEKPIVRFVDDVTVNPDLSVVAVDTTSQRNEFCRTAVPARPTPIGEHS